MMGTYRMLIGFTRTKSGVEITVFPGDEIYWDIESADPLVADGCLERLS